ncbi:SIR2 family protein [Pontibacter sp. G13]|uniref:SIR2 family NAD-dependent protein deacylase n=1 Tax=Pontibacter sp. G13 TaxID=3074898 RepID=UPI002889619B|nr:SIR2 family protein [Pontibacter sp. G13]WNJ19513.1 SIR2 family protein [Pontibacter sp. G13]
MPSQNALTTQISESTMLYSTHSLKDLITAIKERKVILFVGGGVSMNLGLPSWDSLIDKLARDLGYETEHFRGLADRLMLAEYYQMNKGIGSLRSWMDRKWHNMDNVNIRESRIHQLIVELNFPIIYTTNYDRWIEFAFDAYDRDYIKIADVTDLKNIEEGTTQIIKYHGDFDHDDSIVLTETSYFERLDFETPLDLKLRADVLGRSILFIGYSISDINIRYLLYKLNRMWERATKQGAKPKSFILLMKPNPVLEQVLENRGITTLISTYEDPKKGLTDFLEVLYNETREDSPLTSGKVSGPDAPESWTSPSEDESGAKNHDGFVL